MRELYERFSRLLFFLVMVAALVIAGMMIININNDVDTNVTREITKVGLILNGVTDDGSWGQSHYSGLEKVREDLNLEIVYRENTGEDETCAEAIEELIGEGCGIIIANSFGFGEYVSAAAEAHPDIYFLHATGTESAKNLCTYFGRIYQMRYLTGIVAGLQTETNEIGYVAAFPISEVNRGINAFTLGVRSVNPEANVRVIFCNDWTENEAATEATERLLAEYDIDVLTLHADSLAPLEVAEQAGIWTIGYNVDNSARFPDTFLTAATWKWEKFYGEEILACLQGKFYGAHIWFGIEEDSMELAPLTGNVKPGTSEVVREAEEALQGGSFDVFYGPIVDNEGALRVGEGESMSDEAMLDRFDWYVEGVTVLESIE